MSHTRRDEFTLFGQSQALLDPDSGKGIRLFTLPFPNHPFEDLQPRVDGVRGTLEFRPGDRVAYHTAYCQLWHEDADHHPFLQGYRFHVQQAGTHPMRIVDKDMGELQPQGLVQYPYENIDDPVRFDTTYPGGTLLFAHHRPNDRPNMQLMGVYRIPPVDPTNEQVKWYYQRMGLFVAVHDEVGVIAKLIVASMHPRYAFGTLEVGLSTAHFQGIVKEINRGRIVLPGSEDEQPG